MYSWIVTQINHQVKATYSPTKNGPIAHTKHEVICSMLSSGAHLGPNKSSLFLSLRRMPCHAKPLRSSPPRCRYAFDRKPNSFFGSGSTARPSASLVSAPSPVIWHLSWTFPLARFGSVVLLCALDVAIVVVDGVVAAGVSRYCGWCVGTGCISWGRRGIWSLKPSPASFPLCYMRKGMTFESSSHPTEFIRELG